MAILSREELFTRIRDRIGEDESDDVISLFEDVADTFNDLVAKSNDTTDWKNKYEENDKAWRKKYKDRFFNTSSNDEESNADNSSEDDEESVNNLKYENLFKEEEK